MILITKILSNVFNKKVIVALGKEWIQTTCITYAETLKLPNSQVPLAV